jgi:hypothetical protein
MTWLPRTDKKQHFSEKVAKVESILAADGKAVEKQAVTEDIPEKKDSQPGSGESHEQKQPLTPGTNKGTWASMLKK